MNRIPSELNFRQQNDSTYQAFRFFDDLVINRSSGNFVQWDNSKATLQLSILKNLLARMLSINHNIVEPAAGTNFQSCCVSWISKCHQLANQPVNFSTIEALLGIFILKLQIWKSEKEKTIQIYQPYI